VATYGIELNAARRFPTRDIGRTTSLQLVLNRQARAVTGCFSTTPIGFLMAEGGSRLAEAITHGLEARLRSPILGRAPSAVWSHTKTADTIHCLTECAATRGGFTTVEEVRQASATRLSPCKVIIVPAAEAEATACTWRMLDSACMWTDGSRLEDHSGIAYAWLHDDGISSSAFQFYLGPSAEVYDAELYAILMALQRYWYGRYSGGSSPRAVTVFSDAQAALTRLRSDAAGPGQDLARDIHEEIAHIRREHTEVEFRWVPSHVGVPGNEAVDAAAKKATLHRCNAPPTTCCSARECHVLPWTSLPHVNHQETETHSRITREWIAARSAESRAYVPKAKWGINKALRDIPKKRAAVFFQLASGHALIGTHLVRIKKESAACWWCHTDRKQTRGHLFGDYRATQPAFLTLLAEVERITGKQQRNRGRLKAVEMFKDERLTEAVLEFLAVTGIGRWYE
jgi:ribonuclease HI